jgi:hypothetical protein
VLGEVDLTEDDPEETISNESTTTRNNFGPGVAIPSEANVCLINNPRSGLESTVTEEKFTEPDFEEDILGI